ncbi:hypothetical protein [Maritimibacter sp. DP1N21-5]|uniref:hypothetical protein n=1 Tax=Maritimibacter sp. DP1N21-5 TaxID=2836867 RepID=UPI001C43BDB5|nr:hypothetical protein [Maritimibacter sp. DP1N21-5]MBV7409571.1 hypothetical protein [Maritimibacter sp. DP1N21-5]
MKSRALPILILGLCLSQAGGAMAQDAVAVPPPTIFDWPDRLSLTLREQGQAAIAAGKPQKRLLKPPPPVTEKTPKRDLKFGGEIYTGFALAF